MVSVLSCHPLLQGQDDLPGRLVMGTRCGDLDPAVVLYIQNATGRGPQDMDRLLNKESGLLGLAGKSDIRAILQESAQGSDRANLALNVSHILLPQIHLHQGCAASVIPMAAAPQLGQTVVYTESLADVHALMHHGQVYAFVY